MVDKLVDHMEFSYGTQGCRDFAEKLHGLSARERELIRELVDMLDQMQFRATGDAVMPPGLERELEPCPESEEGVCKGCGPECRCGDDCECEDNCECPGCGCRPGDGRTDGCDHPDGCGYQQDPAVECGESRPGPNHEPDPAMDSPQIRKGKPHPLLDTGDWKWEVHWWRHLKTRARVWQEHVVEQGARWFAWRPGDEKHEKRGPFVDVDDAVDAALRV